MQSTPLLFTNTEDKFSCVESHIMSHIMKNIIFTIYAHICDYFQQYGSEL